MNTATDMLTTLDRWNVLVGVGLPLIIALINQSHWAKPLKAIVSIILVLIASAITVVLQGNWNGHDWIGSIIMVGFFAYASYQWLWKPSTIAPQIESATSTGGPRPVA